MKLAFRAGACHALPLEDADVPALQRFIERNPEYAIAVDGEPPGPHAAREAFDARPPEGMPYRARWMLRFLDASGEWVGVAEGLADFLAERVWHIGLFIVATSLHGRGAAPQLYEALERRIASHGAEWIRLGVVVGNARAERFWERAGYVEVRRRDGIVMGRRTNAVRVMVKPLGSRGIAEYLARVARDRPDPVSAVATDAPQPASLSPPAGRGPG